MPIEFDWLYQYREISEPIVSKLFYGRTTETKQEK